MRTSPVVVLALLLAAPVRAEDAQADAFMSSMSVAQLGSAGLYGSYDPEKSFVNPSILSTQPRTWAAAFSTQERFGGDQWLTSGTVGWVGEPGDLGTFGAALMLARLSAPEIVEVDIAGNPTGVTVSPSINFLGLAVLYQWNFFSLGAGGGLGQLDLGTLDPDGVNNAISPAVMAGTNLSLGRMSVGLGLRMAGGMDGAVLHAGLAFRTGGWFRGTIGGAVDAGVGGDQNNSNNSGGSSFGILPSTELTPKRRGVGGGGVTWEAAPFLTVRAGLQGHSSGLAFTTGFSVPWRDWSFNYALQAPLLGSGEGLANAVGVGWNFGNYRKKQEGPKFFMKQEERTLAVAAFDAQNVSAGDAAVISDMLRNQLIREGAFNVVEKANMDKILGEQAFQQTGCTTSECAVKLGKVLNVKFLAVGSFGKALDQYVLSMRVVDVETAKAVYSDEIYGKNLPEIREGITQMATRLTEAVKKAK